MTTLADAGWCLARCSIGDKPEEAELVIVELPDEGSEASGVVHISGLEAILAIRNCIDDEVARMEQSIELGKQDIGQ